MKRWIAGLLSLALVLTLFTPTLLPAFAESSVQTGKVNYSAVHLRSNPWGQILDLIYEGASVEVLDSTKDSDGNTWYEVRANGRQGYMYAEYIDVENSVSVKDQGLKGSIKVTWDFARVRKTPWGVVLGQLDKGQSAEVVGKTTDSDGAIWYKVKFNGQEGYMHEENVSFSSSNSSTESAKPNTPTVNDEKISGSLKVTWDFARVRQTPWGTVLGELKRGETAVVVGKTKDSDGDTWYKVKFDGTEGYMHEENISYFNGSSTGNSTTSSSNNIKDESLTGSLMVTYSFARVRQTPWGTILGELKNGQTAEVIGKTKDSDRDTWYKVKFNGKEGYMHEENVAFSKPLEPEKLDGTITVTYTFARIRQIPWGIELGQLKKGQSIEVTGSAKDSDGATWYQVKYNGKVGYIHHENVSFTKPLSVEKLNGGLKVTYTFARVRQIPWGTELGQLTKGQSAEVTGRTKDSYGEVWYRVDYNGKVGYIHEENVSYSSQTAKPDVATKGTLRVNYSVLNVREKPTTSSGIVTTVLDLSVHEYTDVTKDSRGDSWYKISKGWVHGDYVDVGTQKVNDIGIILSSMDYTGNPIEITANAYGTSRALYRISIKEGSSYKILSDFSETNKAIFTPKSAGSYTIKVEAKDIKASKVEKTFEQKFTLKENGDGHSLTYVEYGSLEEFARSQVGRAVKWKDGYWVDATYEEILAEMDPQNALTFDVPTAKGHKVSEVRITGTVNVRSAAGISNNSYGYAYAGETYKVLDETKVNGETWYKITFSGKSGWFHSDYGVSIDSGKPLPAQELGNFVSIISNGTALRKSASSSSDVLVYLAANSSYMILDKSGSWIKVQHNGKEGWIKSTEAIATDEVNKDMFMFLDLRSNTGISIEELNKVLKGKGILEGHGAAFVEASKLHDINEIYLVSHALLETGNGSSALATGQVVSGVTVYNMYGIGAYDSNPITLGAQAAYDNGWTTPEKAIIDGAKWISKSYVHNSDGQYTLYKMRYNYLDTNYQYATDIAWAKSQTSRIRELYGQVTGYSLRFEIPLYTDR